MTDNGSNTAKADDDPYIWLEDVESAESLAFAKACNDACLASLGDPTTSTTRTYERVLAVLESEDRIPHVSHYGLDDTDGQPLLYNFWQDASHPKGLWRQTTLESYQQDEPHWNTVLDVDELAAQDGVSWVYKGNTPLPRARDESSPTRVARALISLSRGGSDAVHIREFDLLTQQFVGTSLSSDPEEEQADPGPPFVVPEAKTRVSYKSRNVLLIGTEVGGKDSLTDSGYPRQIREWVRGTRLDEAPVVFEGEKTDVSVGLYIADERIWGGALYEVRYRSLTFYTSIYWCRKISRQHLLAPNDPEREGVPKPPDFVKIDIPDDASISFLGQMSIISLRSDWQPSQGGRTFPSGAILWTLTDPFLEKGAAASEFTLCTNGTHGVRVPHCHQELSHFKYTRHSSEQIGIFSHSREWKPTCSD